MKKQEKYVELLTELKQVIDMYSVKDIVLDTIIITGSNHTIDNLDSVRNNESDIDIIILTEVDSFQINTTYNGIRYDISLINQLDIINLLLAAYKGSQIAGKIFSSINASTIIKDKKGLGVIFINVIKKLYVIFIEACIPSYTANQVFLYNINANLTDTRKQNIAETFFAYHRLSNHVFEYISKLIYPFYTSGSYRGQVFDKYLEGFQEKICLNTEAQPVMDDSILKYYVDKFSPVLEYHYKAVAYDSLLKNEILSGSIHSFYFGYDNLISETTVVFLPEEELLKNKNKTEFKALDLSNIVPYLLEDQLDMYSAFLVTVSQHYLSSKIDERKYSLHLIIDLFYDKGYRKTINQSLKAILIIKSAQEISEENILIDLEGFQEWLLGMGISFLLHKKDQLLPKNIEEGLLKLFNCIEDSTAAKEQEIKVSYIFFGIMKALRINIEDLDV